MRTALLRELFDAAVAAADPMLRIPEALPERPENVFVIGAGKASARMAEAVESVWGPCPGFVITRYGYGRPTRKIEIVEAAHPVPDQAGADATAALLAKLQTLGTETFVLALISGGGSALLCAPIEGMTLTEKMSLNDALLRSGAPIDQMNTVRKHLSRVKGGQLAAAAYPAPMLSLLISDVPGDDPAFIASGPTVADETRPEDARNILERYGIAAPEALDHSGVIRAGDHRLSKTETRIIAAPSQSLEAAAELARDRGIAVEILGDALEGEARDLGSEHADLALSRQSGLTSPLLLLSGGECTVTNRGKGGIGGPNAEYALAAGLRLNGAPGVSVLACDTDGVDGAAEVAGACFGPDLPHAAARAGVDLGDALDRNDSHTAFAATGHQVVPGPTLTNVNDFRAILIDPKE